MDSTIGFPNTYPLDGDLSVEQHHPTFEQTGARPQLLKRWITQLTLSTAWINLYPMDSTIGFPNTYPLDGDLSVEQHHPTFEQTGARPQLLKRWITQLTLSTAWINLYPMDSTIGFPNTYPLDGDLSVEQHYPTFEQTGARPQQLKRWITLSTAWINLYPNDSAIGFPYTYPLDSGLSSEQRYPMFEQLGPGKSVRVFHLQVCR